MIFDGEVIKNASSDPCFRIVFSCKTDRTFIQRGFAEIVRKGPKPVITYGPATEQRLKDVNKSKLELELLNKVIEYLIRQDRSVESV